MNEIKLLPHNQDMVEKIKNAMVFGNRKIFYTEATGLGKSYIFMYLVHKYFKNKKVLYITPKYHIWYNLNEYKEFELIKDCVTMACYADFNKLKEKHLGYDVIFIDEAHHLPTDIQGKNIITVADTMLATNPNAYVFGFTATPYVDGEFIGDAYFETSVIGMDLFDAIEKGILQKIHYAVAVKEDIKLSDEEKLLAIKYNVDTTRLMVRDIVDQYPNVKHWLAYFPFIDELNENIKYFDQYFPDYKIFTIHSEIENSENILNEFEDYDGKAILASVSMVLEGIHPKSVEGILLYRNVCTSNTFFQIIGRLGIMKSDSKPICIDIYGSYNNLINECNIINEINNERNNSGKKCVRDHIYMESNTYKFIELSEVIRELRYNTIQEYRDITWRTDMELSIKLGKSRSYIYNRIKSGKTYEQIIDMCLDIKSYRGITWTTDTELNQKLGKHKYYVQHRIKSGKTYEQIIDMCLDIKSYRGITWTTDAELNKKLNAKVDYVRRNIRAGKTYEQIIDMCLDGNTKNYRGIEWSNNLDLSRKLGKNKDYIFSHIKSGKTYEQIIDMCLDGNTKNYRGIEWNNDTDLSRKLGKNKDYISLMTRRGKTREELIDYYLNDKHKAYRGITWMNKIDLSKKLGKCDCYVSMKIREGKTFEQIIDDCLDNPLEQKTYRGIEWITDKELSIKLGKPINYVHKNKKTGKTYEEIIDSVLDNAK